MHPTWLPYFASLASERQQCRWKWQMIEIIFPCTVNSCSSAHPLLFSPFIMATLHFSSADFNRATLKYLNEKVSGRRRKKKKKVVMRLHTAAWLMCRIRGVRLKQCTFNCSWLYWGTPQGMLSDANPLMPCRCDMLAICGRSSGSGTRPEAGMHIFRCCSEARFHHSVLDVSLYIRQGDFPTLPITYVRIPLGQERQAVHALLWCTPLVWSGKWMGSIFYRWIIPHCIHNVRKIRR